MKTWWFNVVVYELDWSLARSLPGASLSVSMVGVDTTSDLQFHWLIQEHALLIHANRFLTFHSSVKSPKILNCKVPAVIA